MSANLRMQFAFAALAASIPLSIGHAHSQTSDIVVSQLENAQPGQHNLFQNTESNNQINTNTPSAAHLLTVPQVHIVPGAVSTGPKPKNPMANDPSSAERGMRYFNSFNCVGCHAANGGGGMGISLSNENFKYGSDPANLFLVISHGAPLGMPAWGTILPDSAIWDLVSYIESISKPPNGWGTTVSVEHNMPAIEQVPAEFMSTTTPWQHVQPFSSGQKPTEHNPATTFGMGAGGRQ